MEIITGDLDPLELSSQISSERRGNCTNPLPISIDDLHICGQVSEIDGVGKVLGSAGPLVTRNDLGKFTAVTGRMK